LGRDVGGDQDLVMMGKKKKSSRCPEPLACISEESAAPWPSLLNLLFVFARLLIEFDREPFVQRTFVDWFSRARGMSEAIASESSAVPSFFSRDMEKFCLTRYWPTTSYAHSGYRESG